MLKRTSTNKYQTKKNFTRKGYLVRHKSFPAKPFRKRRSRRTLPFVNSNSSRSFRQIGRNRRRQGRKRGVAEQGYKKASGSIKANRKKKRKVSVLKKVDRGSFTKFYIKPKTREILAALRNLLAKKRKTRSSRKQPRQGERANLFNKISVLLRQNNKTGSRRAVLQYQKHLVSVLKSNVWIRRSRAVVVFQPKSITQLLRYRGRLFRWSCLTNKKGRGYVNSVRNKNNPRGTPAKARSNKPVLHSPRTQQYKTRAQILKPIDTKIRNISRVKSAFDRNNRRLRLSKLKGVLIKEVRLGWEGLLNECQRLCYDLELLLLSSRAVRYRQTLSRWKAFWALHHKNGKNILARLSILRALLKNQTDTLPLTERSASAKRKQVRQVLYDLKIKTEGLSLEILIYFFFKIRKRLEHSDLIKLQMLEKKHTFKKTKGFLRKFKKRKALKLYKKLHSWLKHSKKWRGARKQALSFKASKAKQAFKAERYALLQRIANRGVVRAKEQKFHRKSRFITYYSYVDGVYNSYWFGKFVNMFIREGKKRRALSVIHTVFSSLKFTYDVSAFRLLINTLNKLRSVFKLRKYKVRKGREIKEYPALTKIPLLYMHVLIKIKKRIIRAHYPLDKVELNKKKNRGLRIHRIKDTVKQSLAEYITNPRKHVFVRERRTEVKNAVRFMINRRFNKKKQRQ